MTRATGRTAGVAALLAGPTVLAFFSGGYFDQPRLWAAIAAFGLVLLAVLVSEKPLPSSRSGQLAIAGLAALTGWTALSIGWAPLAGPAFHDMQRLLLYLALLVAAAALLREWAAAEAVEPALAAGALIVIGYGLAGRLLPGVVHLHQSLSAAGRLEQPLTYWNATGALAAMGFVLCARLTGDPERRTVVRAGAAAASVPLGVGVYLSFSRGALAAVAAGLLVLLLLAFDRRQLRAIAVCLAGAVVACVPAGLFGGVRALHGSLGSREGQGAIMLVLLLAIAAACAYLATRSADDPRGFKRVRRSHVVIALGALLLLTVLLVARVHEKTTAARGATTARLGSVESNRYAYWKVAGHMFTAHPLRGEGSASFGVEWLKHRKIPEAAQDAHSLYIETAAELGLVGLAALALFLGGAAVSARRAFVRDPALTAGWIAASSVWLVHAGLDWDWEMPAVTLLPILLAGGLIAQGDRRDAAVSLPAAEPAPAPERQPLPTAPDPDLA
ncbi:MAG TPA: O-antigen ligase family protein [Thermoleophilaceae bacterium]|nr:O-antigen ligase family protein [Thermoleophilaceae bacterium]